MCPGFCYSNQSNPLCSSVSKLGVFYSTFVSVIGFVWNSFTIICCTKSVTMKGVKFSPNGVYQSMGRFTEVLYNYVSPTMKIRVISISKCRYTSLIP